MARLARIVIPDHPHHITQRGNGGQKVFFSDADYGYYLKLLREACVAEKVQCLAYVLMPNHVHLILVPKHEDGLRSVLSKVHRAYAGALNARRKKTGHFWQGRFGCVAMEGDHAVAALRYVLLNPVRAKLAQKAIEWPWSSAKAYVQKKPDGLTDTKMFLGQLSDIKALLGENESLDIQMEAIRQSETIGRPLGSKVFLDKLERKLGRKIIAEKRGPKPRNKNNPKTKGSVAK